MANTQWSFVLILISFFATLNTATAEEKNKVVQMRYRFGEKAISQVSIVEDGTLRISGRVEMGQICEAQNCMSSFGRRTVDFHSSAINHLCHQQALALQSSKQVLLEIIAELREVNTCTKPKCPKAAIQKQVPVSCSLQTIEPIIEPIPENY